MNKQSKKQQDEEEYMRYYDVYGSPIVSDDASYAEEELASFLANDEISDGEEGFLAGYENDGERYF